MQSRYRVSVCLCRAAGATALLTLVGSTANCSRSPSAPTTTGAGGSSAPAALTVTAISPNTGSTLGATVVRILGAGFLPGATVTLETPAQDVNVVNGSDLTARIGTHAAGRVDVVVTNPDGHSGRLPEGFTYVVMAPLGVATVSPSTGSTGGDTFLKIMGTGFASGATVTLGGTPVFVGILESTTIYANSAPHPAGTVDVVVTNRDGHSWTLVGGYTYAPPESFDFNGDWEGGAGSEQDAPLRFTIHGNVLTSLSCGSSGPLALSPPPVVTSGEFSYEGADGVKMSGGILAPSFARGSINLPACPATTWSANKL